MKEKIYFKADLALSQQEIYDYIFARIYPEDASVIPYLLQWLLLESENLDNKHRIDALLNGETYEGESYWMQAWDAKSEAYYYIDSSTNESSWETPDEYWGMDEMWHAEQANLETIKQVAVAKAELVEHELLVRTMQTWDVCAVSPTRCFRISEMRSRLHWA